MTKQRGGARIGAGRKVKRKAGLTRLYIPNEILCQVKEMIRALEPVSETSLTNPSGNIDSF